MRQRESLTTHVSSQVDDDSQITFGDAPLLQSRLPIPLHMIPNADCYVGRGGRLCYGTPSEPDSSDSDSSGQWPFPRIARQGRADEPAMSPSHDHASPIAPEMNTTNAEGHVLGTSGSPAALDPSDIIIISDDEDEQRDFSGQSGAVDTPGIVIISDEDDQRPGSCEQPAAVERSRFVMPVVSNDDEFMAGADDIGQDCTAGHGDTVISRDDVVNSAADEPVQVLTRDTPETLHHAGVEVVSTPMPRSQAVRTELYKVVDRLTLSEYRMLQHRRPPFLRRNVRRGFFIKCERSGRDVTPAPCLDGHIAVDFKYYLRSGPQRETGPYQIYHGSMLDWSCPLCNMHRPFPNRGILSFHLGNDHKPVTFNWTDNGQQSVSYPPQAGNDALTNEFIGPTLDPRGDPAPPRGARELGVRVVGRR